MRLLLMKYSTSNIAVSEKAAISLYGEDWQRDSKNKIIYCGVDYNLFKNVKCSFDYHAELSIPKDALVIGHVGRIEKPKNHAFMIEIIKALHETSDKYYLVFVGDGSLRQSIEALAEENGVKPFVRFMGTRSDIPELMCCLFDIFIFPSLWEGLPLTLIEAQFANLPCLVSDAVTKECNLGFSNFLPINDLGIWVNKII
jgi:glycosyltransferase involved in cell wall biosynthesis